MRYKITRGGLLFSFAIVVVGVGAVISANNLLFLIVAAMLATLLVSGFVSRLCLAGLDLDFLVPEHVPAGRSVPGKLFVRNQKWLIPSFSIRVEGIRDPASPTLKSGVYFPLISAGAIVEETVEVRFPRRGAYRQNSFAFSTAFPFGFLEKFAREQEQTVEVFLDRDIPHELDAWFEHAIDCCAFLLWRLSNQGASIHFRSSGFDFRQPEDGDIYAILKYLALVYPQGANPPEPPLDEASYKIVFTPSPRRFSDAGWVGARVLDPDAIPIPPAPAAEA